MANLREITEYKNLLMEKLCSSKDLCALLTLSDEQAGQNFAYKRIFPYAYVPNATQIAQSYVCFDIEVPSILNKTIKNVVVYVYVFTEKDLMRIKGKGIRVDMMASEVDQLLNGNTEFGFGELELSGCKLFTPIDGYYGRKLIYTVQDFNRNLCKRN